MSIHITRWRPDTCTCVLEYTWDDTVDQDVRLHKAYQLVETCPDHDPDDLVGTFNQVVAENQLKNNTIQAIANFVPGMLDGDGGIVQEYLDQIAWTFDPSRNLIIAIGFAVDKTALQASISNPSVSIL